MSDNPCPAGTLWQSSSAPDQTSTTSSSSDPTTTKSGGDRPIPVIEAMSLQKLIGFRAPLQRSIHCFSVTKSVELLCCPRAPFPNRSSMLYSELACIKQLFTRLLVCQGVTHSGHWRRWELARGQSVLKMASYGRGTFHWLGVRTSYQLLRGGLVQTTPATIGKLDPSLVPCRLVTLAVDEMECSRSMC